MVICSRWHEYIYGGDILWGSLPPPSPSRPLFYISSIHFAMRGQRHMHSRRVVATTTEKYEKLGKQYAQQLISKHNPNIEK